MHLIGVLSQQLLPRKPEGLFAAIEHLQNEGATRKWIRTQNYGEIGDLLNRADTPNKRSSRNKLPAPPPKIPRTSTAPSKEFPSPQN
jgi:Tfp pilus assembly pilus retraction ATPase PilT